jgi:hypothetical protein
MLDCLNSVVLACITVYILQFAGKIAMEVLIFPLVSLFTHEMIVCEIVKRKIVWFIPSVFDPLRFSRGKQQC